MPKNKILIIDSNDTTAKRFAKTLQPLTASEIVDFTTAILAEQTPLSDTDGGKLYVLGSLSLASFKISDRFDAKDVAGAVMELGLTTCSELWLVVCNSGTENPFKQDKVFLDDFVLELRKASLMSKVNGRACLKVGKLFGYKGYVGFYDNDTERLEGGTHIKKYLEKQGGAKFGVQYIHTEPTAASQDNKFIPAEEGVVVRKGFNDQSWEIHESWKSLTT